MANCTFTNLTKKQAKMLAEWYEGQGEQDADVWFDCNGVKTPMTDCGRDGGYKEVNKETGDVIVYCR